MATVTWGELMSYQSNIIPAASMSRPLVYSCQIQRWLTGLDETHLVVPLDSLYSWEHLNCTKTSALQSDIWNRNSGK